MNDYSMIKDAIKDSSGDDTILLILLILISVNIVVEIIRLICGIIINNKETKSKRKLLIEEKRIKILEQLFKSLDSLSLYDRDENQELLIKIKEINTYIRNNKLYISKKYQRLSNDILDYFKNVMIDYRCKSIEKETKLFEKFCNAFNK